MFGGAMRQVGVFAAAAIYALDHNMGRLMEDHDNARRIAEILADNPRVVLDPSKVQTNILVFDLTPEAPDAAAVVAAAHEQGVLIFAFGPRTIRAVTHLDVTSAQCERAGRVLSRIVAG
jgi:threonine aldolase